VRGGANPTGRLVVDIEAAARAGLAGLNGPNGKIDLADIRILFFVRLCALEAAGGGDAPEGLFVEAGFERMKEVFARPGIEGGQSGTESSTESGIEIGIASGEEYAARIEALSAIGALEVRSGGKAGPLIRLSERVSGDKLFPATVRKTAAGRRRGMGDAPVSAAVRALLLEDDAKRRLDVIAAYLDSEYDMGDPAPLSEFLDVCMGIIRGECDTAGMHVGGVYDSVYDPKSLKSLRAALSVVYNAVSVVAPMLDSIGVGVANPCVNGVANPRVNGVAAPCVNGSRLDVGQFRELVIDYVKEFSRRIRARGTDCAEIEDYASPEAVAAFSESVEAYLPGEPPRFYVETVLGCGPR
jgi:hypothetical protein